MSVNKNHNDTFGTPEGYFENFNERLMARMNEESNKESNSIPKNDGFTVPEGYFQGVLGTVTKRLSSKKGKIIVFSSYRKFYYAAAAVAALLVLTLFWNQNQETSINFEDLASSDIDSYFENYDLGLSSYEIATLMDVDHISISDISEESIEEDIILDYLEEHVDEIEDLNLDYEELQ